METPKSHYFLNKLQKKNTLFPFSHVNYIENFWLNFRVVLWLDFLREQLNSVMCLIGIGYAENSLI